MPQSLCQGMSEMPSVTPIGLKSASMRLCARLVPNSWPAPASDARPRKRSSATSALACSDARSNPCMRTRRVSPAAVRAHQERPSPSVYVGAAWSMSADIASISDASKSPSMCRNPAVSRKWRISSRSSSGRNVCVRSSGRPSRSSRAIDPGV